jgi:hypothetical protein
MAVHFEIYREGQRLDSFEPVAACAIGPESVPVPGEVVFRDGLLTVNRPDEHAVGVSLMWDAGPTGCFHLETTRLPHRKAPYVLNVELARLRLMKLLQKQEDWYLFDLPKAERFLATFREAQDLLAQALGMLDRPAEAARLGDEALLIGMALSEDLSLFHGDLLIQKRKASNGFVKHIFGCRVDPTIQNQKYRESPAGNLDYAVVPMPWRIIQPQEHACDLSVIDACVETLTKKRLPVVAGPLIDFREGELPDWLFIWENDFETLRGLAYEHVQKLVQRYRKAVSLWNVVGGIATNSALTFTFEQMIELTRLLVAHVKNLLPSARTLITVTQPFGEYHAANPTSISPLLYAEMTAQAGINFDGFSVRIEMGVPQPGMFMRDLFQISSLLDRFSTISKPVFLTAVCAPGRATPDPADRSEGRLDPAGAGRWRRPWDLDLQADWMEAVYKIALSKPFVESIAWTDLADLGPMLPAGGLMDDRFQPKPVLDRHRQMREHYLRRG